MTDFAELVKGLARVTRKPLSRCEFMLQQVNGDFDRALALLTEEIQQEREAWSRLRENQ